MAASTQVPAKTSATREDVRITWPYRFQQNFIFSVWISQYLRQSTMSVGRVKHGMRTVSAYA
jgi:hypothetical protein